MLEPLNENANFITNILPDHMRLLSTDSQIETARNLPPCGCKSMAEGPSNMLGVFITLLYTYTMPINHYCTNPTSLGCHLMAKHCLRVGRNQNLRQEICPHVAVIVWQRALEICWECSLLCYTPIQCQSTTIIASLHLWGAT